MAWVQERLRFTRQQKKQLAWLWRTYNDKMQSLMPRRQHLMDCVNSADALTAGLPIHRPGQPATSPMLDPAEALVDHLKLMQVIPSASAQAFKVHGLEAASDCMYCTQHCVCSVEFF